MKGYSNNYAVLKDSPVVMYDPYSRDLDHLDKTLFLENRMRIQENIINKHKIEAERSRDRNGRILSKHPSMNELNQSKLSYAGMYNKQQSFKTNGFVSNNQMVSNLENVWLPKDTTTDFHQSNTFPESLDTARGKAKYALVRLDNSGQPVIPHMFLESVNPMVISSTNVNRYDPEYNINSDKQGPLADTALFNQQLNQTELKDRRHKIDPNNFIGSENRVILEKVNGIQTIPDETDFIQNQTHNTEDNNKKGPVSNTKKLIKRNSKITLDVLNVQEDTKHPLLSRKPKPSIKIQNRKASSDTDNLPYSPEQDLNRQAEFSPKSERKDRRFSRDTNHSHSRKSSTVNSRQSFYNLGKNQKIETTLSFVSNKDTVSQVAKRSRDKNNEGSKHEVDEISKSPNTFNVKPRTEISVKKKEFRPTINSHLTESVDTKQFTRKSHKSMRSNSVRTDNLNHIENTLPNRNYTTGRNSKAERNKEIIEGDNLPSKENRNDAKQKQSTKTLMKPKDTKPKYVAKNRGLRKTDSFKMMGNSSHYFGYCSVPENGGDNKQLKSILKKPKMIPERPDTA